MPDKLTDKEIVNEYKMFTPEECLQKIVDQHKEINRLQAENERLKGHQKDGFFNLLGNCLVFSKTLKDYNDMRKGLKAEAYKECIEKVKDIDQCTFDGWIEFPEDRLDNLLKEMERKVNYEVI